MNKLYSDIEEIKKDLKENGEIIISDFSKEAIENLDNDKWVFCGSTSRGNHIMAMKIAFGDSFSNTPQFDTIIRYIVIS